jgi:microcystin-dependent protein
MFVRLKKQLLMRKVFIVLALVALLSVRNIATAQNPFVGQIRMFAGNFPPLGWAFCDGQLLNIADNTILFALIGTTYGGDGVTTFALPDLRGRVLIGPGQGPGLSNYVLAQEGGAETVTLTVNQMPQHMHTALADSLPGSSDKPTNLVPALYPDGIPAYGVNPATTMNAGALGNTGGSQPHNNIKPYVAIHYIISLFGIFPSQN